MNKDQNYIVALESEMKRRGKKIEILRGSMKEQVEISNCVYDFIDEVKGLNEEDLETLLTMVTVPGLKDALKKVEIL